MKPRNTICQIAPAALLLAGMLLLGAPTLHAISDRERDKKNYNQLIDIIFAGTKENQKIAKDVLRSMGEVGIKLLKSDCRDITSPRGAFVWSILKEFLVDDKETLREFARKNVVNAARQWNRIYTERKRGREKQKRLENICRDYVDLLVSSSKEKDFDLLLKALRYSLITGAGKVDYGGEFDIWQKIWDHLAKRIKFTDTRRDLEDWQKTIDAHFRRYSQQKVYVGAKTIGAYHTTTLLLIKRIDDVRKAPPKDERPDARGGPIPPGDQAPTD